jgi:hypothetical protein
VRTFSRPRGVVLHGVTAVAELKHAAVRHAHAGDAVLHGVTAVAELKPSPSPPDGPAPTGAPRRHRRGRIEALPFRLDLRTMPRAPRRHRRGRIEASPPATRSPAWAKCSTASPPWPN